MARTVTAAYKEQEQRQTGAKPQFYVGFMRTSKEFDSDDYSDGTHTNTIASGFSLVTSDYSTDKIYIHSVFSATISSSFASPFTTVYGISVYDSILYSVDAAVYKIYQHSGITSDISNSFSSPSTGVSDVYYDGTRIYSSDILSDKIYKHSTGFSDVVTDSFSSPASSPRGIAFDGTYLYSVDGGTYKIYKHSGFNSRILSSFSSPSTSPRDIAFDGTNIYSTDINSDKIYQHSGFSDVILSSFAAPDAASYGITLDIFDKYILLLTTGESSGNWISDIIDTGYLTPNTIFDKISWTEVLNGGTIIVQIRTGKSAAQIVHESYHTYTSGTLDHTARYRFYQIKISFTSTGISPTLKDFVVRHKALIPRDEYMTLGSISYGLDIDFAAISAGGFSITLDNLSNQWDKYDSDSYIYQKEYHFEKLELWAGFELRDGTTEWLLQFIGEIENLSGGSGGAGYSAIISARDFLYRKLSLTKIGQPTSTGTPSPYRSGKRYRVPCIETDTSSHIFSFYSQQSITSIDATYTRDSESNQWEVASPSSTSTANKTVTFAAGPEADVSVDITINAVDHPCDIITDIITNEIELDSDEYDAASIALTKSRVGSLVVGVTFDNMTVLEAFRQLGIIMDAGIYIESGVMKVVSYYPVLDTNFTVTDKIHQSINIVDSVTEIQNTAGMYYADYETDNSKYVQIQLSDSVDTYGELTKGDYSYTYTDPVSITSALVAQAAIGHWLSRQDDQFEIMNINLPLDILRMEILDILAITAEKHNLSGYKVQAYSKNMNFDSYGGSLRIIKFTTAQYGFAQDADATEDLFYFVDDPVPDNQLEYRSYGY